jgi:hypothetical protein
MGVLTDFVVADRSEAKQVGDCPKPSKEFAGIDAKGMDPIKMGTLHSILTGAPYDPEFLTTESSFLYTVSDDGPWVQIVPDEMVARLTKLEGSEIRDIAAEWQKTEEFDPKFCGWKPEDVQWFLRELSALSRKAVAEQKSLLMWTCL